LPIIQQLAAQRNAHLYPHRRAGVHIRGRLSRAPPLVLGGSQSDVIKIKGTLGGCVVTKANASDPDIHVISGGVVGLLNSSTNDCLSLLGSSSATGSVTVKWKTLEKLTVATTTTQITGGNVTGGIANPFSDGASYGTFTISGAAVSGAFLGTDNGATSFTKAITQEGLGVLGGCAGTPPVPLKGVTLGSTETHFG
jgi:hypothetical protein